MFYLNTIQIHGIARIFSTFHHAQTLSSQRRQSEKAYKTQGNNQQEETELLNRK